MTRRIVLVGFMASGKTTVGALLAEELGWRFLDMDQRVAAVEGMSVAEIFDRHGEARFRKAEAAVARELLTESELVVAAGGGGFAETATRTLLQDGAFTVHLHCEREEIERRLEKGGERPLARTRGIIPRLLAAREPAYALADWRIDTTHDDAAAVARRIADVFRARAIVTR